VPPHASLYSIFVLFTQVVSTKESENAVVLGTIGRRHETRGKRDMLERFLDIHATSCRADAKSGVNAKLSS
jgi:hypothetical protein